MADESSGEIIDAWTNPQSGKIEPLNPDLNRRRLSAKNQSPLTEGQMDKWGKTVTVRKQEEEKEERDRLENRRKQGEQYGMRVAEFATGPEGIRFMNEVVELEDAPSLESGRREVLEKIDEWGPNDSFAISQLGGKLFDNRTRGIGDKGMRERERERINGQAKMVSHGRRLTDGETKGVYDDNLSGELRQLGKVKGSDIKAYESGVREGWEKGISLKSEGIWYLETDHPAD